MKNKIFSLVLILVLGLVLGYAVFKILERSEPMPESASFNYKQEPGRGFFCIADELELNEEQKAEFREFEIKYRNDLAILTEEIRDVNERIINELGSENPDTILLFGLSEKTGFLHEQVKRNTINHFMNLRSICSNEQSLRLSGVLDQIGLMQSGMGNRRGEGRGQGRRWRQQKSK